MVFVCDVTLQDHVIKALYDFIIRNLLRYITILANLTTIENVISAKNDFNLSLALAKPRDKRVI